MGKNPDLPELNQAILGLGDRVFKILMISDELTNLSLRTVSVTEI